MGIFRANRIASTDLKPIQSYVTAAVIGDRNIGTPLSGWIDDVLPVTRDEAMTVPAVARARNLICTTIGTLPLETYNMADIEVGNRQVIEQPDPLQPRANTFTYLADDILFHGVGYMQVLDVSPQDGRPFAMRRINPNRVTVKTNDLGTMVESYFVDGMAVPVTGVGSLKRFDGLDEGINHRGGRTIRTAIALEKTALKMAIEPAPSMVLKNNGMNMDEDQKSLLKTAFARARRESATALIEGDFSLDVMGFDSAQLQLVEARSFATQEIARMMGVGAWYLNAETASATYSNVQQERRSFVDFALRPLLHAIEARLSMDDITPRGQYVEFDLDDFLRGNSLERVDVTVKLLEAGIITVEEARHMEDLAPTTPTPAESLPEGPAQ